MFGPIIFRSPVTLFTPHEIWAVRFCPTRHAHSVWTPHGTRLSPSCQTCTHAFVWRNGCCGRDTNSSSMFHSFHIYTLSQLRPFSRPGQTVTLGFLRICVGDARRLAAPSNVTRSLWPTSHLHSNTGYRRCRSFVPHIRLKHQNICSNIYLPSGVAQSCN
jgi:hypothetical protein